MTALKCKSRATKRKMSTHAMSPLALWARASKKSKRTARRWAKRGRILGVTQTGARKHYRIGTHFLDKQVFEDGLDDLKRKPLAQDKGGEVWAAMEMIDARPRRPGRRRYTTLAVARVLNISRRTFYRRGYNAILSAILEEHDVEIVRPPAETSRARASLSAEEYEERRYRQNREVIADKKIDRKTKREYIRALPHHRDKRQARS